MRPSYVRAIGVAAICAALAGCGGGGGDSTPAPVVNVLDYPIDAAFTAFFAKDVTYTANAKDAQGNNYFLSYRIMPVPDETQQDLSALPLKVFAQIANISVNGVFAASSNSKTYYSTAPFLIWGTRNVVVDKSVTKTAPPATAKVGSSGSLSTGFSSYFKNSTLQTAPRTITWSLETDTDTTAWLCINISTADATGPLFESDCGRINQAGEVSGFRSTAMASGITLNFK